MNTPSFSLPTPGILSREDELQRLHNVTRRIDTAIPFLFGQRAIASGRVNALQSSTRHLPVETLSIIFTYATNLSKRSDPNAKERQGRLHPDHFLLALAGVSSLWRYIILSDPQLWTYIRLDFNGRAREGCLNLLRLYLMNSGALKLDVELNFHAIGTTSSSYSAFMMTRHPWPDRESLIDPSIDTLVIDNLHRIRHLHLQAASVKWLGCTSELPSLTYFGFSANLPSPGTPTNVFLSNLIINEMQTAINHPMASFSNSPHLHTLVLAGPGSYIELGHSSHWSTITTLELSFLERITCMKLLTLCSNVEVFRCRWHADHIWPGPQSGANTLGTSWSSPVIRQSLRVFDWDMSRQADQKELQMFKYLHVPTIQRLDLRTWNHGQLPDLREFCSRLPPSIASIHLSMLCPSSEPTSDCIFASFHPLLQTRELGVRSLGGIHAAYHTLRRMTDPDFFPNVERLRLLGPFPSAVSARYPSKEPLILPKPCAELILQIVRARLLSKRVEKFCFEFKQVSVTWTPELRAQLRMLEDKTDWNFDIVQDDPAHLDSSL